MSKMKIKRIPYEEFLKNPNTVDMKELQNKEPFEIVKEFCKKVYDIEITKYVSYYYETTMVRGFPMPTALVIKYY